MSLIPGWILVIPILTFLVFVHELGHFAVAKKLGIKVTEFGFGFPPRLWGIKRGETLYSVNIIPLGGFVKMVGEEDPFEQRSFARQPVIHRMAVLLAGPLMNLFIPILIFTVLLALPHDKHVGTVMVGSVAPHSPATEAGIRPGDAILGVNGEGIENHADLIKKIQNLKGKETALTLRRNVSSPVSGLTSSPDFSHTETVLLTPRKSPPNLTVVEYITDPSSEVTLADAKTYDDSLEIGDTLTQGSVGVLIGTSGAKVIRDKTPLWKALPQSLTRIVETVKFTFVGLSEWIGGGDDPGLAGPIGIAQVTGEVANIGVRPVLELTALISISLALVNILPIPALDGGRLFFILIEWVRGGKRISPRIEGIIHMAGFATLIGLIVVMSYFDVLRIISGGTFIQ